MLWELVRFRAGVERDTDPRDPGNLRTIALPLRILLESVVDRPDLRALLVVDDAEFTITSRTDSIDVEWGRSVGPIDIIVRTDYEAFLDVGEGMMTVDEFVADHVDVEEGAEHAPAFLTLLGAAVMSAGLSRGARVSAASAASPGPLG